MWAASQNNVEEDRATVIRKVSLKTKWGTIQNRVVQRLIEENSCHLFFGEEIPNLTIEPRNAVRVGRRNATVDISNAYVKRYDWKNGDDFGKSIVVLVPPGG